MKKVNPLRDWKVIILWIIILTAIIWAATRKQFDKETFWMGYDDSIKVKITRIRIKEGMTHVTMKSKNAKYKTVCFCKVPYKEKQIIYIKKP